MIMHKLEQGLARIDSRGGTAMRDAISMSLDYMKKNAKKDKKVLMVITDGADNASNSTAGEGCAKSQPGRHGRLCHRALLRMKSKSDAKKARRQLNELTESTGGIAFYPQEVGEVQSRAMEIAHDIRNQYTIAYEPSLQQLDGSYRQIKVTVDAPGKPTVRTRSGYYATPDRQQVAQASGGQ